MIDILYQTCKQLANTDLSDLQAVQDAQEKIVASAMLMNGWKYNVDENRYIRTIQIVRKDVIA